MSGREVRLTLSADEQAALAALGVQADPHGFLTARDGSEVSAGTAARMLKSSRDSAGRFSAANINRGYLDAGHAAQSAGSWTGGIPEQLSSVRPQDYRRAYLGDGHQAEEAFSAGPGPVSRGPLAGSGVSPLRAVPIDPMTGAPVPGGPACSMDDAERARGIAAKAGVSHVRPEDFRRGYLAEGHAAERPYMLGGVPFREQGTGQRPDASDGLHAEDVDPQDVDASHGMTGSTAGLGKAAGMMPQPHPIVADQFRQEVFPGQERRSPGDTPGGNDPWPASMPAEAVYETTAADWQANRDAARADSVELTGRTVAPMAPAGWAPPAAMDPVPLAMPETTSAWCGTAPGETGCL